MSRRFQALRPLRHCYVAVLHQFAASCHLNIEIRDLLSEGISVNPKQIRTFCLISARRFEGNLDQRGFDLAQDSRIEPGWRQHGAVQIKVTAEVACD